MGRYIDDIDEWEEYIPDIDDNRLDDNPMTVELQPMSTAEVKAMAVKVASGTAGKKAEARRNIAMTERIISNRVRNIKRYRYRGVDIKTGEDLATHGEPDVCNDVMQAIIRGSVLADGIKKNSESLSLSSQTETSQPTDGGARSVAGQSGQALEYVTERSGG